MFKVIFSLIVLLANVAHAQMSEEDALARLHARQAAALNRPAPKPVIIATKPAENPQLEAIIKDAVKSANAKLDQLNDSLTTANFQRVRAQVTSQIVGLLDGYSGQKAQFLLRTENVYDLGNGDYLAIGSCELPMCPALMDQYRSLRKMIEDKRAQELAADVWMEPNARTGRADSNTRQRTAALEQKYNSLVSNGRIVVLGGEELLKLQRGETLLLPAVTVDRIVLQGSHRKGFVDIEGSRFEKESRLPLRDMQGLPGDQMVRDITSMTAYVAIGTARRKVPNPPNEPAEKSAFEFSPENTAAMIR